MSHPILQFCDKEHAQIERYYQDYLQRKGGDIDELLRYFKRFKCSLHRHMCVEEDVLFDYFEKETGLENIGPTFLMRKEHKKIRNLLKVMQDKLLNGNRMTANDEVELLSFFQGHGAREDEVLINIVNAVDEGAEVDLISKLNNYSKGCCQKCLNRQ